jgi:hypothetical protein
MVEVNPMAPGSFPAHQHFILIQDSGRIHPDDCSHSTHGKGSNDQIRVNDGCRERSDVWTIGRSTQPGPGSGHVIARPQSIRNESSLGPEDAGDGSVHAKVLREEAVLRVHHVLVVVPRKPVRSASEGLLDFPWPMASGRIV